MKNILIIAAREFKQIASMRSFWLTLLILPVAFAIGPMAQRFLSDGGPERVVIIDKSGGGAERALVERFAADLDRAVLDDLSRYVQRHKLERADPAAPWASHDRWYGEADIAAFRAAGGLDGALARIDKVRPAETPRFEADEPAIRPSPAPAGLAAAPEAKLDERVRALLAPADETAEPVDYVLLVPSDFGTSPAVRLWAQENPSPAFIAAVQDVLTGELRARFLEGQGVSPEAARAAGRIAPALSVWTPPPGGGARESMLVRSILPLAACYLLMMSLMLSGSWMLQGTVEERSNRLLETVLACVTPEELMYGKLLGTLAVGLSMVLVWVGCGVAAAYATHGAIADLTRPALAPLASPATIAALIYFFVAGYIAHSTIFLAIGSMSESMREAQGYLMPVLLAVLLPISLLMQAIVAGGGGLLLQLLTWIPFWSPFTVLARLGTGIPAWEVIGSGIVLGLFTAALLVLLGRVFRASLLAQGQRPGLAQVIARMRRNDEAAAQVAGFSREWWSRGGSNP